MRSPSTVRDAGAPHQPARLGCFFWIIYPAARLADPLGAAAQNRIALTICGDFPWQTIPIKGKVVLIRRRRQEPGRPDRPRSAQQGAKAVAIHYNSAGSKAEADATVAAIQPPAPRVWHSRPT